MGEKDSSLTRVQPILGDLLQRPAADWLSVLLSLGSRANACCAGGFDWVGNLQREPPAEKCFEWCVASAPDYLKALLVSTDRLRAATEENPKILTRSKSQAVNLKRKQLVDGDAQTVAEGLQKLDSGRIRSGRGTWWVLEGTTKVDCAIFAEKATVFIEGKRTDRLSKSIKWDLQRNQIFRNLDALRVAPYRQDDFFMLVIVEENSAAAHETERLDRGYDVAVPSWPHLSANEASCLYEQHYLGFTTWQKVTRRFGITLYDKISDQPRKK